MRVQDAMRLVAEVGPFSLFITITTNPKWPEVMRVKRPQDRFDISARAFYQRVVSSILLRI